MKLDFFDTNSFYIPTKLKESLKENNLKSYSFENFDDEIDGFCFENKICINGDKDFYKQRFTLGHELGHKVLNHKFGDNREDKEADNFSLNFYVDEKEFKEKLEVYKWNLFDCQSYFGVPYEELEKYAKKLYN